jgi:hypothetical protein
MGTTASQYTCTKPLTLKVTPRVLPGHYLFFHNSKLNQLNMLNKSVELLENNLQEVWNQRDPALRLKAIEKIYAADASLYHVGSELTGHDAINNSVTTVLKNLPPGFEFNLIKPIVINNKIGRAIWGVGLKGQPPASTGMDIAVLENGMIQSLYVFLDL